jgi:hypothetical protein
MPRLTMKKEMLAQVAIFIFFAIPGLVIFFDSLVPVFDKIFEVVEKPNHNEVSILTTGVQMTIGVVMMAIGVNKWRWRDRKYWIIFMTIPLAFYMFVILSVAIDPAIAGCAFAIPFIVFRIVRTKT